MTMLPPQGTLAARIWRPGIGPALCTLRDGVFVDVTCPEVATMRDLLERDDAAEWLRQAPGTPAADPDELSGPGDTGIGDTGPDDLRLLAPCDLQAVKAAGVTFAESMIERVIEEQAAGDPDRAEDIRRRVKTAIGDSLSDIEPGSDRAQEVKRLFQKEGLWSQYLEVGIGPDAEIFTKCQPMAAVGHGAAVGVLPMSRWNNPEPEIVLAVDSRGRIRGASLGNDVNLRDIEGRSALLLGKAKDNNASAAIGPTIRLFDDSYSIEDLRAAEVALHVAGEDGFTLNGRSAMARISRRPEDLVAQALGRHHQYPDGMMLYLGTLFAPVEDRDTPGQGFTHKPGDRVTISEAALGRLENTVRLSTEAAEWTFGTAALMRNLAARGLL